MKPEVSLPCLQQPAIGPYLEPNESSPHPPTHPISLRSILILSSHLRLPLLSGLYRSGVPTKILYAFLISPRRATCPARLILRHPNNIRWSVHVMKLLIMHSSPVSRHFLPGADHSHSSSAEVKGWVELYLHSPNTPSWSAAQLKHRDNFTFNSVYSCISLNDTFTSSINFHKIRHMSHAHRFLIISCIKVINKSICLLEFWM
jgi:hypothetical protein